MKVTTDACLFGAWVAREVKIKNSGEGPKDSVVSIPSGNVKNVLDIGAGTGLLSLMFVQKNSSAIDAIEIDDDAFGQAKENVAASPFAERLNMIQGDVKMFQFERQYDVIISNPPFYENEIRSTDPKKNVAHHHSGLLLDELLSVIKANLKPEGIFYLLLPYKRTEEIKKTLFEKDFTILKLVFVRQSTKHEYFRIMLAGSLKDEDGIETTIDEISIWDDKQLYTDAVKELLKDYYLYLRN